jgi:type IV secretory pathway VirB3-like protein
MPLVNDTATQLVCPVTREVIASPEAQTPEGWARAPMLAGVASCAAVILLPAPIFTVLQLVAVTVLVLVAVTVHVTGCALVW